MKEEDKATKNQSLLYGITAISFMAGVGLIGVFHDPLNTPLVILGTVCIFISIIAGIKAAKS